MNKTKLTNKSEYAKQKQSLVDLPLKSAKDKIPLKSPEKKAKNPKKDPT